MADGESHGAKLLRFWAPNRWAFLWLVLSLAPLFFFETTVHEGLHWIRAELGGKDATLIPFAHQNTQLGQVNGATMNTTGSSGFPQLVCFVLLLGVIALFILTSPRARWLRMFLTWWYLGLVLDLIANTWRGLFGTQSGGKDWAKFARESGDGLAQLISWAIMIAVLSQLVWTIWGKWPKNRPEPGNFWSYRGAAVFLGIVSAVAIVASFTVDHPSIQRNWWFTLVLTWQMVSFLGYFLYVMWVTFKRPASLTTTG